MVAAGYAVDHPNIAGPLSSSGDHDENLIHQLLQRSALSPEQEAREAFQVEFVLNAALVVGAVGVRQDHLRLCPANLPREKPQHARYKLVSHLVRETSRPF